MRAHAPIVGPIAVLVLALVGCARDREPVATAQAARPELGVEQLAKAPASFARGRLTLRGVVAFASAGEHRFTLIDEAEYRACRELSCSAYEVPVAFAGALPETAQAVRIVGRLVQPDPEHYLVQADSVAVLP